MSGVSNIHSENQAETNSPLNREELIGLNELAGRLPQINGRRPSVSTLWRWCLKGIGGIRLEHIRRGRVIATSVEAVSRFSLRVAAELVATHQERMVGPRDFEGQRPQSVLSRERRIRAAEKRVTEAGV